MQTIETLTVAGEDLAALIRREHEAASKAARSALEHALEAGRLLSRAREGIGHGGWETFVRDRCGIAPRTARLYLRLDANRERLANRQRVAGLTVREAARLLAEPKLAAAGSRFTDGPRRRIPDWYRHAHRHYGQHPSGWFFEVWPHPAGDEWAHYFVAAPESGHPGDNGSLLVGPMRGIRVDAIEWSMNLQTVNGMPSLDDDGWKIFAHPCDMDSGGDAIASRFRDYNTLLFADEDDYRRRGLGIEPRPATEAR